MALVAATVANGGTMMNPYYIDHIETYDGDIVKRYAPVKYKELMSEEEVDILSGFMKEVVTDGTARKISGEEYTAAGEDRIYRIRQRRRSRRNSLLVCRLSGCGKSKTGDQCGSSKTAVPEVLPQSRQPRWYLTNGGTNCRYQQ